MYSIRQYAALVLVYSSSILVSACGEGFRYDTSFTEKEKYSTVVIDGQEFPDGPVVRYDRVGREILTGAFVAGKREGSWLYRDETGTVILTETWASGQLISEIGRRTIEYSGFRLKNGWTRHHCESLSRLLKKSDVNLVLVFFPVHDSKPTYPPDLEGFVRKAETVVSGEVAQLSEVTKSNLSDLRELEKKCRLKLEGTTNPSLLKIIFEVTP